MKSNILHFERTYLGSMVTLVCMRQSTRVSFMGWLYTPSFVSGLNAWIVVFGVEHEEYVEAIDLTSYVGTIPTWLASYFPVLCDLPLLFVYFQVNTHVLYFLDYVEDIYNMVLSVLVSTLNLNHT